jgi:exodeoxyribonuclease VII large subunit
LKSEVRALRAAGRTIVAERRGELRQAAALLESFSYQRVLERGFALVTGDGDSPIDSVTRLSPGMPVSMRFHDGEAGATVNGEAPHSKPKKAKKPTGDDDPQGTLL